jgi:hypothetical protein
VANELVIHVVKVQVAVVLVVPLVDVHCHSVIVVRDVTESKALVHAPKQFIQILQQFNNSCYRSFRRPRNVQIVLMLGRKYPVATMVSV